MHPHADPIVCSTKPFLFGRLPLAPSNPSVRKATIHFIKTRGGTFGITNQHVIHAYRCLAGADKSVVCRIDGLRIQPGDRLIDENAKLDIATVSISESELNRIKTVPLFHGEWPVKRVMARETVLVSGYSSVHRTGGPEDGSEIRFMTLSVRVGSVSEKKFGLLLDPGDPMARIVRDASGCAFSDLGGFSGSGVYRMNGTVLQLVGIAYAHQPAFDILYCTHSDYIRSDGRIQSDFVTT